MAVLPPDPIFRVRGDMGHVHSICFANYESDYTSTLLAATESGFVYLWDLQSLHIKHKQEVGKSIQSVKSLGQSILTQSKCGSIKKWIINESRYECTNSYNCYGGYCRNILHHDKLYVPEENGKIGILDTNLKNINSLKPSSDAQLGMVMCLEVATVKDNSYILAGYETGDIVMYDLKMNKPCAQIKLKECTTSITFDSVTLRAVSGNSSDVLQLFTIGADLSLSLKCEISLKTEGVSVVKLRPDKKILTSGGWDGRLRLYSWKSLRSLAVLTEHRKNITDVQFSSNIPTYRNSYIMATSGEDGFICLWNLYN